MRHDLLSHIALAAQQCQRVVQFVIVVALKCGKCIVDERLPHVDVIVLMLSRCVGLDELGGEFGLDTGFTKFANQRGRSFFGQQGFACAPCGNTQEEGEQRAVVAMTASRFGPSGRGLAVKVVDFGQTVFYPKVAPYKSRCLVEQFLV